jgi:DNA replication protein DnaD
MANLPKAVVEIGQLNIRGTKLDDSWFRFITFDNGKPYMLAILIISELCYWYTPSEIKDENTGSVIGYKKKFKSDKLQRSFQALGDRFGFSKRQATDACHYLKDKGLITIEYKTIRVGEMIANNVTYLEPVIENIKKISSLYQINNMIEEDEEDKHSECDTLPRLDVIGSNIQKGEVSRLDVGGVTFGCETNTTTSSVTSSLTNYHNNKQENEVSELIWIFERELSRPLKEMDCDLVSTMYSKVGKDLTVEALRRGNMNGIRNMGYIMSIVDEFVKKGIRSIDEARKEENDFKKRQDKKNKKFDSKPEGDEPKTNKYEKFYL